jgi:glycosyltransferase involved in cell wall biosynthesis
MINKIVIALICHFSNSEVQSIIKPWKRIPEMAPWIPPIASIFENYHSIELHIISPHEYIYGNKSFQLRNVYYHFYNAQIPIWGRHWPVYLKFDYWSNFFLNKFKVKRFIKKINPDIIHLFGAENAYYSSTILQFANKYPIVITVQGFISKASGTQNNQVKKRIEIENEIIKKFVHYITNTETVGKEIVAINLYAKIYRMNLPIKFPQPINNTKIYDLVFFARVCKNKGIEDLLQAISIIKKEKPDINLCVIGGGKLEIWKEKAAELNISDNIYWAGFLPTQKDVHNKASTARISVLPTYHDIISGTIVESLFLKLPVVAYNVGSIHEVNEKEDIITLVHKFDIEGLAKSILKLLNDQEMQQELAEKGYHRANEMFNTGNDNIRADILNAYYDVIKDFKKS